MLSVGKHWSKYEVRFSKCTSVLKYAIAIFIWPKITYYFVAFSFTARGQPTSDFLHLSLSAAIKSIFWKISYYERSLGVFLADNVHDGVDVQLDVVVLVDGEVLVGVVPVAVQGDLVLVVPGPESDRRVVLKSANLKRKPKSQGFETQLLRVLSIAKTNTFIWHHLSWIKNPEYMYIKARWS